MHTKIIVRGRRRRQHGQFALAGSRDAEPGFRRQLTAVMAGVRTDFALVSGNPRPVRRQIP